MRNIKVQPWNPDQFIWRVFNKRVGFKTLIVVIDLMLRDKCLCLTFIWMRFNLVWNEFWGDSFITAFQSCWRWWYKKVNEFYWVTTGMLSACTYVCYKRIVRSISHRGHPHFEIKHDFCLDNISKTVKTFANDIGLRTMPLCGW